MAQNIIDLNYLKEYMEKNKISKKKLAELIDVNYTTVYRVFRGDRNPGTKFIVGLINGKLDINQEKIFLSTMLPEGND